VPIEIYIYIYIRFGIFIHSNTYMRVRTVHIQHSKIVSMDTFY